MSVYQYIGNKSIYYVNGEWYSSFVCGSNVEDNPTEWREINPDPTIAHTIELDSCNAVITADSCYFRDAAAPVLTLEEMQRVTRCMEMLKEVNLVE